MQTHTHIKNQQPKDQQHHFKSAEARLLYAAAGVLGLTGQLENALQPATANATAGAGYVAAPMQAHVSAQGSSHQHRRACRALCIGVGGGSLPHFLSLHYPGLQIDAVELDPLVITAATQYMGFPKSR